MRRVALLAAVVGLTVVPSARAWTWPADGPVLRPFAFEPSNPYAAGQHRGVDIGGTLRSAVSAAAGGVVSFAGSVPHGGKTVSIQTADGYTVTLTGTPAVGDAELTFTVKVDGQVVRTEAYLGAAGHLDAIRRGDLAYLHVHPHDADTGDAVTFTGEFPTAGTYRLFFDFSHDGTVRTAASWSSSGATNRMCW